ncbi:aldehyde dehydrogenase family protein [Bordetella sp. 02P26C-1]|uniref:aldehyde dehydrogenase family protein n=1 Tax=Bordetella sp. 02P26C-1 TaxID=2683195 RepID=UPI0013552D20|nr:aldehyde dehydrogenase family protein [Bordetella sp. 02P26C-1]MVW79090.1 aldehyde dehydrogenase family protein [Bordetella sp. 02P26C-1]
MTTIFEPRADDGAFVLPGATIAGVAQRAVDVRDTTPIYNAATGVVIGWQEHANVAQIDDAVRAARTALPRWRATTPASRGQILKRIAELIEHSRDRLVGAQMRVSGKPPLEAEQDVSDAVATFDYYAALCDDVGLFAPQTVSLPDKTVAGQRYYDAVGVAALIVPWNFPMVTTAWKMAPALAAGCTVVLKPSELTSPVEHMLVGLLAEAGVPDGVVNMVNGGAAVGTQLVEHPLVDKVSFTGSTEVGKRVMRAAANDMKRTTLELGGKSALIVRADADLDSAVSLAVSGAFGNAGQMCSATARILVQDQVYNEFLAKLEAAVGALMVAPPMRAGVSMGPLVSASHLVRVRAMLDAGISDGAAVAFSGRLDESCGKGFFLPPMVVTDPDVDNVLWTDEVFGPVACVKSFHTDDEAIQIANSTRYGLVATVLTADASAAKRYQYSLRAGLVWINTPQLIFPQLCWGGLGLSGIGRELGVEGLRSYQELRHTLSAI